MACKKGRVLIYLPETFAGGYDLTHVMNLVIVDLTE